MSAFVSGKAPNFKAKAVMPDNSIKEDFSLDEYKGKYVVLFFWPEDFTFVCPTEILEYNKLVPEFEKRGVQVIGVSTDSHRSHLTWKMQSVKEGGIGNVQFPIVADFNKDISLSFGVLMEDAGVALRASFLIDKEGTIQHAVINNLPLGRNTHEMIRMIDALKFTEEHGEVCPANWNAGQDTMKENTESLKDYFAKHAAEY